MEKIIDKLIKKEDINDEDIERALNYNTILMKLFKKEEVTNADIASGLYEVCDEVHASCDDECPIYKAGLYHDGCKYFKDGKGMLKALRENK